MAGAAAAARPAYIVESGPAAGVDRLGRAWRAGSGIDKVITFDMGGTTAKASLVEGGRPHFTAEFEVAAGISASSRLSSGGGYALSVPFIDLAEVGAGGGSIIWLDPAGAPQGRAAVRRRDARARLLRQGRRPADGHRREPAARLPQPGRAAGRRDAAGRRRGRGRVFRRDVADPLGPGRAGGRVREPPAGEREHDPRDQVGLGPARPRSARLHAGRVRRQRAGPRGGDRARARHPAGARAAATGRVLGGRAAPGAARVPREEDVPAADRALDLRGAGRAARRPARRRARGPRRRQPARQPVRVRGVGRDALRRPGLRAAGAAAGAAVAIAPRGSSGSTARSGRARANVRPSDRERDRDRPPARRRARDRPAALPGRRRSRARARRARARRAIGLLRRRVRAASRRRSCAAQHLAAEPARGPFVIEDYDATTVVPPDFTARRDRPATS